MIRLYQRPRGGPRLKRYEDISAYRNAVRGGDGAEPGHGSAADSTNRPQAGNGGRVGAAVCDSAGIGERDRDAVDHGAAGDVAGGGALFVGEPGGPGPAAERG